MCVSDEDIVRHNAAKGSPHRQHVFIPFAQICPRTPCSVIFAGINYTVLNCKHIWHLGRHRAAGYDHSKTMIAIRDRLCCPEVVLSRHCEYKINQSVDMRARWRNSRALLACAGTCWHLKVYALPEVGPNFKFSIPQVIVKQYPNEF